MTDTFDTNFPNPSPQLQTVIAYLRAVASQQAGPVFDLLTDDHQYEWIARGFDHLGPRIKDRAQTEQFYTGLFGKFVKNYKYTVKDYIEMPGKVMLQVKGSSELITGKGTYDNEYVWIFHLTEGENGQPPKIKHAKEFFDSLYASQFFST